MLVAAGRLVSLYHQQQALQGEYERPELVPLSNPDDCSSTCRTPEVFNSSLAEVF